MKLNKIKNILNYVSKLISSALLVVLIIIGLFLVYYLVSARVVSKNPGYEPKVTLYTIVSGSMEPNIKVYDVVLDFRVDKPEQIKVGDVITFKSTSNISRGLIVTHRVVDIKQVNGKYEYVTKGDFNPTSDSDTAKFDNIIGKVVMRFPQLGRIQFFLITKLGWFLVVLLPASCVIIYDIIKLIKLMTMKNTSNQVVKTNNKSSFGNKKKLSKDDMTIDEALNQIKNSDYISKLNDLKNKNYK